MRFHKLCGDCLDRMNSVGKESGAELINSSEIFVFLCSLFPPSLPNRLGGMDVDPVLRK